MKMKAIKRFIWKLIISGVVLYILSMRFADISVGIPMGVHPLELACDHIGLEVTETSIESWLLLSEHYETDEKLTNRMNQLVRELGMEEKAEIISGGGEAFCYLNAEGKLHDGGQAIIILQSINESIQKGETHLGFTISYTRRPRDLADTIGKYERILRSFGCINPVQLVITGEINGELSKSERESLFRRCFKSLEAVRVDGAANEEGYSNWRGRTRCLPGKVRFGPDEINLEIAVVFDHERDVTVVSLGAPMLTGE
jgi:hypothetical protein